MATDILKGASATPLMFLMVLASDHITGATGLSPTVTLSKNGGSFASPSGAVTEVANGWYKVAGNATDSNTAGPLVLHATAGTADPSDVMVANIIDPTVAVYGANAVQINAVATTSVTAINANMGTTQPINFTSTGASALVKSDMVDVAGAAVSATTAQIGVNVVNIAGTAQTARDLGASVLLSSGTGTGQISLSSGKVSEVVLVDTLTTYTGNTVQTGDAFARIGAAGVGLTNLGDTRVANLDATVSSRTKPADTQAAVTTVTNLTNAPTAGDFTATMKTSLNAATPASVVGAVGSVTGNVGGNVVGSVASVTAPVTVGTINAAASNIKKNTSIDIPFPMTDSTTHQPSTGLTVTAQRSIDGAAYGACANAVTEVGSGTYNIVLAAADTNGSTIIYKFTASGADTRFLTVITQP